MSMTVQQAAAACGKAVSTVRAAISRGKLRAAHEPVREGATQTVVMVAKADLDAWVATAKVGRPAKQRDVQEEEKP